MRESLEIRDYTPHLNFFAGPAAVNANSNFYLGSILLCVVLMMIALTHFNAV